MDATSHRSSPNNINSIIFHILILLFDYLELPIYVQPVFFSPLRMLFIHRLSYQPLQVIDHCELSTTVS